jgi:hypothetical protein
MSYFYFVIVGLIIFVAACSSQYPQESIDEFAQCLTEEGAVMYGAFWCPHCAKTKKKFGSSFKYINYVECDAKCEPDENGDVGSFCNGHEAQTDLCIEKGIENYDTWEFPDGSRVIGEPTFQELSEKTGCVIEAENGN